MDLTQFVKHIDLDVYKNYLEPLNYYDQLVPDKTHNLLVNFFSQNLTYWQWSNAIDNLNIKDYKETTTKMVIKLIIKTLDNFLQAFALGHMNPLHNVTTLEQPHLNECLKATLWYCAEVYYTLNHHIKDQREDGIGFTIDSNKHQMIYVEGSHPYNVKEQKEIGDRIKIARNL
nr:4602_t:CDS:2 [Entrophospora candida]